MPEPSKDEPLTAEALLANDMQESWAEHMEELDDEFDDYQEPHVDPLERELAQEVHRQPQTQAPPRARPQPPQHHQTPPRSSPSHHSRPSRGADNSSRPQFRGAPREKRSFEKKVFTDDMVPQEPPFVMYLANLSFDATRRDVLDLFHESQIVDITIPFDKEKRRTKGFGYVVFEDRTSFTNALEKQGADLLGRPLRMDLTEKEKALAIAEKAYSRPKKRSTPSTEADATTNWRTAPKKTARVTRPIRTISGDASPISRTSSANAWGSRQTESTENTTTDAPEIDAPATTDDGQTSTPLAEEESQRDSKPRRNGNSEYRGRGARGRGGSRGTRGAGKGSRGGSRGGKRDSFRGGKSREQMELERDFQKLLQSDNQGGRKSKSNKTSDISRNAFEDLVE